MSGGWAGSLSKVLAASWGQVVVAVVALLAIRIYTALLTPDAFGVAMLVLGGLSLIDGVLGSAFGQTATVMLKDSRDGTARLRLGLALALEMARPALGYLATAWATVAVLAAAGIAREWTLPLVVLAPVYLLAEPVRVVGQAVLLLDRRLGTLSLWLAVDALATVAISSALLRAGVASGWVLVIGAMTARAATTAAFAAALFGGELQGGIDRTGAKALRRQALAFAAPVSAMAPIGWLSLYLDRYIVGVAVGPAAAGVLAALSGAMVRPYAVVSAALTNYFRPDLLDQAAGRLGDGRRPLARWITVAVVIGIAGVIAVALLGGWAVDFLLSFDQPVAWADQLLLVLAGSQLIVLVRHAVDNQVLARGRSGSLLSAQLVAVAFGIPLIAAGALLGGPVGAAIGRACNEGLLLAVTLALVRRQSSDHRRGSAGG